MVASLGAAADHGWKVVVHFRVPFRNKLKNPRGAHIVISSIYPRVQAHVSHTFHHNEVSTTPPPPPMLTHKPCSVSI